MLAGADTISEMKDYNSQEEGNYDFTKFDSFLEEISVKAPTGKTEAVSERDGSDLQQGPSETAGEATSPVKLDNAREVSATKVLLP